MYSMYFITPWGNCDEQRLSYGTTSAVYNTKLFSKYNATKNVSKLLVFIENC